MIKSVFRKSSFIGFLSLTLLAIFCGFFTYTLISIHFFNGNLLGTTFTKAESVIFICLFGSLTFFIIKTLIAHSMNITIDIGKQEIVFINVFFPIKKKYSFKDFDYYFETIEYSIGDTSKAIYLVKDEKRIRAIRSYYYSNVNEMKNALKDISDHGFKELSRLKVILLYFRKKL